MSAAEMCSHFELNIARSETSSTAVVTKEAAAAAAEVVVPDNDAVTAAEVDDEEEEEEDDEDDEDDEEEGEGWRDSPRVWGAGACRGKGKGGVVSRTSSYIM